MTFPQWIMTPVNSMVESIRRKSSKGSTGSSSNAWFELGDEHKKFHSANNSHSDEILIEPCNRKTASELPEITALPKSLQPQKMPC